MDFVNALNAIQGMSDERIVAELKDGLPVLSNPSLQMRRDALRQRVINQANRLINLAVGAMNGEAKDISE